MITRKAIPRRTILKGMGTAIALPFLDAMTPALASSKAPGETPVRMMFVYVPNGDGGPTLTLRCDAKVIGLWDKVRVEQIVTNLLSNAAKFSPAQAEVTLSAERCGTEVRVRVSDRGPGIPREFRERIFQRFAQADSSTTRRQEGTGLGLSISKAIVERLGGRIGFRTAAGHGTTFFFDLPEWRPARSRRK